MPGIRLGEIEVHRILEWEGPFFEASLMFPDATPENLDPHRGWLEPWALCPQTARLILPVQTYLVRTRHHTILVDTCIGNHKTSEFGPWHQLSGGAWLRGLGEAGASPEDVDYVLCTHLHSDHCGWNTRLVEGRWQPTFPKARYLFTRAEFESRQAIGGAPFEESIAPVMEQGQGELVDGEHVLDDEVWLEPTPGHTPGHVAVHLRSGGAHAIACGDLMHSPVQCAEPHWYAVSDADRDLARRTRGRFLEENADAERLILTAHFPSPSLGRIETSAGAFRFRSGAWT